MATANPKRTDPDHLLHAIVADFEALAAVIDRSIDQLAANGGGADIDRLERAKLAAERGREIARSRLSTS